MAIHKRHKKDWLYVTICGTSVNIAAEEEWKNVTCKKCLKVKNQSISVNEGGAT